MEELRSDASQLKFDTADISVMEPSKEAVSKVERKSEELNSPTSEVDEKLLALAYQKSSTIITDDKALQNLALHLEVDFETYMSDPIQERKRWEERCPSCGAEVSGRCSKCGEDSIRRLV